MSQPTLGLNREAPPRPDFENGGVGSQNNDRLAFYNQIADGNDESRADDLEDVTDEMYLNPTGTGGEDQGAGAEGDSGDLQGTSALDEGDGSGEPDSGYLPGVPGQTPKPQTIKVHGQDIELTAELIAKAQKVAAADVYLAEASKLYKDASTINEPSPDARVDDAALADAIQMGTRDEAVAAIALLRRSQSLPEGEIEAVIARTLAKRDTQSDAERFKVDYQDLLADDTAREAVWAFDTLYANDGEAATYERFQKAALQVSKLRGPATGLEDKRARKDNARRPVVGQGARPAPRQQEREPTVREEIAAMAAARHQHNYAAGS